MEAGIMVTLFIIVYQDLKTRSVTWLCFPLLALSALCYQMANVTIKEIWLHVLITMAFLILQLSLLFLYLFLRYKSLNLIFNWIGLGDLLFLICLCFLFSPLNYISFYLISLGLILMISPVFFYLKEEHLKLIPMAGLQAFLLLILFSLKYLGLKFSFFSDEEVSKILLR